MMNGWFSTSFAIRTSGRVNLAESAQQAVSQADPDIPVARFTSMQTVIDDTMRAPRFFSFLAAGFSGFALLLTIIGLFGLLSYQVTQRTREIGVRMALGADRASILRSFLLRGFALAAMGVALGSLASWWLRPVMQDLLADAGADIGGNSINVVMSGAQAMMIAIGTILAASIGASWLPARSAASVEPMQALRAE